MHFYSKNHFQCIHTKDSKMVVDTSLLNPQHYKVKIKGKVELSRKWNSALLRVVAIESLRFTLDYGRHLYLV